MVLANDTFSRPAARRSRSGFSLIELLVVLGVASVVMAIGMPMLWKIGQHYKVHSSAQQLLMLGRQARYESIKLGQQVTVIPDVGNGMFYVISGTLPGKYTSISDFAPTARVAVWQVPRGVSFDTPTPALFTFNSDGSGTPTGASVTFTLPDQPSSKVVMTSTATGKLSIQ